LTLSPRPETDLTSAGVPPVSADDHVRGDGAEVILYVDLGCPHCAATWARIRELPLRLVFRHFPVRAKHPRAAALHAAAEAAGLQAAESFWSMCDSLFSDQGHQDDPHLWERARRFGLDLERFERDRRSPAVGERVRRDFLGGIRAGVAGTPAAFVAERRLTGDLERVLADLAAGSG
jgi:protein-disulfide isomerase